MVRFYFEMWYPPCLSAYTIGNYPEEEADRHSVHKKAGWDYSEPVNSVIVCIRPAEHLPVPANMVYRTEGETEEEKVKISRKATLGEPGIRFT